jgi:hypothetical protein
MRKTTNSFIVVSAMALVVIACDAGSNTTNGSTGAEGPQGPQGSQGPQGPQGPQGNPGAEAPSSLLVINVKDFGAKGDNVTDDSAAIQTAYLQALSTGHALYFPAAHYHVASALTFLLNDAAQIGVTILGDGPGWSVIDVQSVATSPQVLFTCTRNTRQSGPPACDSVNLVVKGIGFATNTTGIGVQIGADETASVADNMNEMQLDFSVANYNTSGTSRAIVFNSVYNAAARLVANVAGAGYALVLRNVSFSHFTGSYGSGVDEFGRGLGISVWITSGFNDGNVFTAPDFENTKVCVISDSSSNQGNTVIGGTCSYSQSGVISTAGARFLYMNPGVNPVVVPAGSSPPPFIGANVGLTVFPPM